MRPPNPLPAVRVRRVVKAALLALLLAATSVTAQFPVFNEGLEGEIWELIDTLELPAADNGNWASGIAWANGELFIVDNYSSSVTKYDAGLALVVLPDAAWYGAAGTPTHGWAPNEAIAADVVIDNQPPQTALVVTDFNQSRIFAFWPNGEHIFTISFPEPLSGPSYSVGLNGVALTVDGQFRITNSLGPDPTLEIVGTLATAWPEYYDLASGGALIYRNTAMPYNPAGGHFEAPAPDLVLTGDEKGDPAVKALTGVTFDSAGNFYMVDSWTGRLHGYSSSLEHLFTFGTPDASGETTLEFSEAYGMTLWPSAAGDRLLITLPNQNAAVVYAPVPRNGVPETIQFLFMLDGLGAVAGLPHPSAFDPVNGRVAVSDSGDNSVKVFQTPVLAVFDLKLNGSSNPVAPSVCGGDTFEVSFSITVPEGRSPVQNVSPILRFGNETTVGTLTAGPLNPRDVISFTYSLTAPNIGLPATIQVIGSASGFTTSVGGAGESAPVTDILDKQFTLSVADCGHGNVPPTVTASVPVAPEPSGWTKIVPTIPAPVSFDVTLNATDSDGTIELIRYHVEGTTSIQETSVAGQPLVVLHLTQPGVSTVYFQAQDEDLQWSPEESITVKLDNSLPSICLVIPAPQSQKTPTEWWWNNRVTIPVTVTDNEDSGAGLIEPFPSQLVGNTLVFAAEGAGQVATVVARDHVGHERELASNTTLDVCGPGKTGREINIDMTGPNVAADLDAGPVHQSPVTVTLSAQDPPASDGSSSGIRYLDYSFDNFATFTRVAAATAPVELTQAATLWFRGVDWAGNVGAPVTRSYTVNRPPTITALAARTNAEGDVVLLQLVGADPDNNALVFSASGLPDGLSIDSGTGTISGTLTYEAAGAYDVEVTVSDGTRTASVSFPWTVTNTNAPPSVTNPGDQADAEGESVSVPVVATDVDGDTLTFNANGLPPGLTIGSSTGVISGALDFNAAGSYSVTVTVTGGPASTVQFAWTVTNVNRPPDVTNPGNQTSAEGAAVTLPTSASDPDGQKLTYSANGLPPGLSIDPATGVITGMLGYTSAGTYTVTVSASDGSLSGSATFTWLVTNTNRPPVADDDTASVVQGQTVAINVLDGDSDPDGGVLSVAGVGTPSAGSAVVNADGTVSYTAPPTFAGAAMFTYTVSDGSLTAAATVTVNVSALPSNLPPVCSAASALPSSLWPVNHKPFYITAGGLVDPEGLPISVTFNSILQDEPTDSVGQGYTMQDGGIVANGTRAWVRAERAGTKKVPGDGRVYLIDFTATDAGGLSCTGTLFVGVPHDQRGTPAVLSPGRWNSITGALVSAPPAPIANDDAMAIGRGRFESIAVLSNDTAYDPITVTIVSPPSKGLAIVGANNTITYKAPTNYTGTTSFTYEIATASGGTDTAVVTITIGKRSQGDNGDVGDGHGRGDDADDCGDRNHDHDRDKDGRDRDHRRGNHDRCRHER